MELDYRAKIALAVKSLSEEVKIIGSLNPVAIVVDSKLNPEAPIIPKYPYIAGSLYG